MTQEDLSRKAKSISRAERADSLRSFRETEMHVYLQKLFQLMERNHLVEVTHGANEFGKDLVIVKDDKIMPEVVGVIVKCGNIKATTHGKVDSIHESLERIKVAKSIPQLRKLLSQARQAQAHHAEVRSSFDRLPVTSLLVVLVGDITRNARQRIRKEIARPIEIWDLKKLVTEFTAYYPQIFFEVRSLDFLQRTLNDLENNHYLRGKKNLTEYFVPPMALSIDAGDSSNTEDFFAALAKKRVTYSNLKTLLEKGDYLFVVGAPGSGKNRVL